MVVATIAHIICTVSICGNIPWISSIVVLITVGLIFRCGLSYFPLGLHRAACIRVLLSQRMMLREGGFPPRLWLPREGTLDVVLDYVGLPIWDGVAPLWGGNGARTTGDVAVEMLVPYYIHYGILPLTGTVHYLGQRILSGMNEMFVPSQVVACEVPLDVLVQWTSYASLRDLAREHRVHISRSSRNRADVMHALQNHHCGLGCEPTVSVFRITDAPLVPVQPRRLLLKNDRFPPLPLPPFAIADMIRGFANSFTAFEASESACSVCGRLTTNNRLSTHSRNSLDLRHLERTGFGVTRTERMRDDEPLDELTGPILYGCGIELQDGEESLNVCNPCYNGIKAKKLTRHALANGLWIGEVPRELQELNFVEKLVIARYRHNVCVVRVDKGQRKMCANAVVFPQPVAKFHDILPPPRAELDECLAVLFTGSVRPCERDYQRTPLLIRHDKVMSALNWLRMNHSDYGDILISEENMATYPHNEPPVSVLHRPTDGSLGGEMLAAYEGSDERGTEEGSCPFAVHGLTGEDLANMSYTAKVATAVEYFRTGGEVLAYGHGSEPASIYHNPGLYPGMFPWLFPYGLGGFENDRISVHIARTRHIRQLLLYGDRRFQIDEYFPFIVFNQEQVRASTRGGYVLTGKRCFDSVVDKLLNVDMDALQSLINRGKGGTYLRPESDAERQCFELISLIDHVACHVAGSSTSRKYQRSEIKSLIIAKGVPVWFITFAPADFKNRLCLYYCGEKIDLMAFEGALPDYQHRLRAIANNPVACARFFDKVVRSFIRHILKAGSDEVGLFGKTDSYYGTVESQGRLTLHLHLLLWIKNSLSPQEIRNRILVDDAFRADMISWLENCHQGGFSTGDLADVAERVRVDHDQDPTECFPRPPPENMTDDDALKWLHQICELTDLIVYRSNRHSENHNKGCIRGTKQYCRARFPRSIRTETIVDWTSGSLELKHTEQWMNTFNVVLSYVLRCNSDVTCLLSGTQVRAVIAYVTDYITKTTLTTHAIFETVKAVLDRNTALVTNPDSRGDAARALLTRIVNALTAMQESPGPMTCAYLLGQPDHYTPEKFKVFYWYPYVQGFSDTSFKDEAEDEGTVEHEKVVLSRNGTDIIARNQLHDYVYRPEEFSDWTLYDYLTRTVVKKLTVKQCTRLGLGNVETDDLQLPDEGENDEIDEGDEAGEFVLDSSQVFRLLGQHPLAATHGVFLLKDIRHSV